MNGQTNMPTTVRCMSVLQLRKHQHQMPDCPTALLT